MKTDNGLLTEVESDILLNEITVQAYQIILHNDDVNTFDWVIQSLIEICNHDMMQAEQCAYIVHHNGKCSVKEGIYDKLQPMASALLNRGLSVTIE